MKKKIGITLAVVMLLVCIISVACLAGCKEKVTAENAQTATEANWAKIDNKSATTTVTITDAEIALGVEGNTKAASIKASAKIDLVRTWKDGVLTIDITAKPTKIDLAVNVGNDMTGTVKNVLKTWVDLDKLTGIEFKGQAFYNYGSEEKTIGIRNLSVTGLKSAIPALTDENITDEAWAIKFKSGNSYVSEVSFDLGSIDLSGAQDILNMVFGEGYQLDLVGIVEGLLVNQTMLDFSNASNAAYADNHYENNGLKVTENLNFVKEIWDQISDKSMIEGLLSQAKFKIGDHEVSVPKLVKSILGVNTLGNLLDDVFKRVEGTMSVSGDVDGGVFTNLYATISGTKVSLTNANVTTLVTEIVNPLLESIKGIPEKVNDMIETILPEVTKGTAYISLGTITVDSTFTVE